jgi:hypothetical protein
MSNKTEYEFDVALSFAGEDRITAEELANGLRAFGVRVFYDRYEQAQLWGKDLYQHLQSVYRDRAQYCVLFVSTHYAQKLWPRHELRQAQSRAFRESHEYILPLKIDDTELPGLNATVGYIDLRENSVEAVKDLVLRKLFGNEYLGEDPKQLTWRGETVEFRGGQVASFGPEKLAAAQERTTMQIIREVPRIRYGDEKRWLHYPPEERGQYTDHPCHDCSAIKGEYHVPTCDMEECPECGGQAIGCDCILSNPTDLDEG